MKTLKFNHTDAQKIIQGRASATWRLYDDKSLSVGDTLQLIDQVDADDESTWRVFGCCTINTIVEKRLEDIDYQADGYAIAHGTSDLALQLSRQYYGDGVSLKTPVKIIYFHFQRCLDADKYDVKNTDLFTEVKLYTDGGSRGNPGPSALGYVVKDTQDSVVRTGSQYLGITTNNQAEYQAVRAGLKECSLVTNNIVHVYLDSQLVANQMNGIYKIKNRELWPIHQSIKQMCEQHFHKVTFTHIPRELNKEADAMVNEALDTYENDRQTV